MIRGSCLCSAVEFRIEGNYSDIGHCHCSKCRKVSGTGSNAVFLTRSENLVWEAGQDLVETYATQTGWKSVFCRRCGSPLPMLGAGGKLYWVPAGALDDDPKVPVARHIFVGSKASWEIIGGEAPQFEEHAPSERGPAIVD